ncbi:zinc metalloprotease HtpX [Candidatus Kaiserbacteria bacterium RIFCSPLOWO2_02_FULL_51_13]|uniref:Protease HtpX homolog n=1 Tax=Candidatus Kaiserbacteria bacterium RIFCSPLOWO2_01_FULL_50_24 TaxID=1798507 RepID=A0A1F6END3_9BACT|nr:MAG: zinc metalloprotease HtpX [Candidatus Kaiserbacteria bacterium RIFCSPLOWO2_01_FULL_50_24]OGG81076.1 MAG: zinc metalloprotease HtpX [Candidatus Kaiserbacteria bacterium RIFCSPLOWO2_02_FULL_51_13]
MASLYTQQSKNIRKTWFLMTGFLVVVIALGWFIAQIYESSFILYIAIGFALVMNITAYWWSDKIALRATGAKEADPKEYIELHRILENLAITAGLPKPRLYIINDAAPNAFAAGRDPNHAVVAVTTGLLEKLDRSELEGVLAHELSHIGNRDILVMTVAVVLAGFVAIVADIFLRMTFFGGMGGRDNKNPLLLIAGVAVIILAPIAAQLIKLAVSRRREFLADASGALLTRYPDGLASALRKISSHNAPMRKANHATAHLFISNPFGAHEGAKFVAKMFSTHPPVEERVKALVGMRV